MVVTLNYFKNDRTKGHLKKKKKNNSFSIQMNKFSKIRSFSWLLLNNHLFNGDNFLNTISKQQL